MEYIGFVFGIFGLMAYLQVSGLKNRVVTLERELAKMQGTSFTMTGKPCGRPPAP